MLLQNSVLWDSYDQSLSDAWKRGAHEPISEAMIYKIWFGVSTKPYHSNESEPLKRLWQMTKLQTGHVTASRPVHQAILFYGELPEYREAEDSKLLFKLSNRRVKSLFQTWIAKTSDWQSKLILYPTGIIRQVLAFEQ